jgi:hypothetical protein
MDRRREGFRMPAGRERSTQYKRAGVGKPPKNERAGNGSSCPFPAVRYATRIPAQKIKADIRFSF